MLHVDTKRFQWIGEVGRKKILNKSQFATNLATKNQSAIHVDPSLNIKQAVH